MMETSPTTVPGTAPVGIGTELPQLALTDLTKVDLDNPHLQAAVNRVIESLNDPNGVISAFQSFTS